MESSQEPSTADAAPSTSQPASGAPAAPNAASAEDEKKFVAARRQLLKILTWDVVDEKHRQLAQIQDTLAFLSRICSNVVQHPADDKYRHIRIANAAYARHVRDALGGEPFLLAAGWRPAVREHEKQLVFEAQPGSVGWRVLEEACAELAKMEAVVAGKVARAASDKKGEAEARLEAVRHAMEDDKEERRIKFQYKASQ